MDKVTELTQKSALIALCQTEPIAKTFFQSLAARDRDSSETSVDRIMTIINEDRNTAVWLMKEIADIGVADFYAGRRGFKTRLVWNYSCKSVGEAALEAFASLQIPQLGGAVEDQDDQINAQAQKESPLMRAKQLLAAELGIKTENIEIVIRS